MSVSPPSAEPDGERRPASVTALVIAVIGLVIAAYLTFEHYDSSATLACPESSTINCAKVTTSRWSEVVGVPVALLGLLYFVAMTALLLPAAWRRPALDQIRIGGVALGSVMVLYLVYIELFQVDAICLWCTGVHVATIALLGAVLWHTSALRTGDR